MKKNSTNTQKRIGLRKGYVALAFAFLLNLTALAQESPLSWQINMGIFNDDLVIRNESDAACSNITITATFSNNSGKWTAWKTIPFLRAGASKTFVNIFSITGSVVTASKVVASCDQRNRDFVVNEYKPAPVVNNNVDPINLPITDPRNPLSPSNPLSPISPMNPLNPFSPLNPAKPIPNYPYLFP